MRVSGSVLGVDRRTHCGHSLNVREVEVRGELDSKWFLAKTLQSTHLGRGGDIALMTTERQCE